MSFFGLFKKPANERVLVIHAGSDSVAAAYVQYANGSQPTLHYTARLALEMHDGEDPLVSLERGLERLCELVIREGAPAMVRAAGSAHVSRIAAYVAAPWEDIRVRTETIDPGKQFTVTHSTQAHALAKGTEGDREGAVDSVIATFLNGYETHSPWGKRATRADFVILSSRIKPEAAAAIEKIVRQKLHQHPQVSAFLPAAYLSVRALYPHEDDYFIIHASGDATSIGLIEHGILSDARVVRHGTREVVAAATEAGIHAAHAPEGGRADDSLALIDQDRNQRFGAALDVVRSQWQTGITEEIKSFAVAHALPRTLFLIAESDAAAFLRTILSGAAFNSLWLADESPRVIALSPANVSSVSVTGVAAADLALMLLALVSAEPTA